MSASGLSFAVIGPGRAGQSLITALSATDWECQAVYGRGDDISGAAADTDVLIVAVPDDDIAAVAAQVGTKASTVVIHLSGANTLEVLAPHQRRASVHPLVSLPNPAIGAARLAAGTAFALSGDPIGQRLVDVLGGNSFTVDERDRSLYHATAAIASNHLVALCAQVYRLAERLGLPSQLYGDLMTTTLENVRREGPMAALTGPAARGDVETVATHISVLAEVHDQEVALYRVWADEARRLGGHKQIGHPETIRVHEAIAADEL